MKSHISKIAEEARQKTSDVKQIVSGFRGSFEQTLLERLALGVNNARALIYTLESLPLPMMNNLISGDKRPLPSREQQMYIINLARLLLEKDARELAHGLFPLESLRPSTSPLEHFSRWAHIMGDSIQSFWRRRHKKTSEFSEKVVDLQDYPAYYQRNFHHQTDGYLTEQSARIYEHQVELLFRGLADPMRRRLLKPLKKSLRDVENPKVLEIACGPGTFTRFLGQAIPNAKITAVDISPYYIQHAKKRFIDNSKIDFMVANAEKLPFKTNEFDAVVAVFLHHELPQKVREKIIDESLRVCKTKGFWGLLDSIQLGDDPCLDWAIEAFPQTFHEPFFTNYIKKPLIPYLESKHERQFTQNNHLLSKAVFSRD